MAKHLFDPIKMKLMESKASHQNTHMHSKWASMLTFVGIIKFVVLNSGEDVEEASSSVYLRPN